MTEAVRGDPVVRAAFLAGCGYSADEIAADIKMKSGDGVSQMLALYGIALQRKPFGARLYQVRLIKSDNDKLEPAAAKRGIHMVDLLSRIVATVAREISVDGLLDDDDNRGAT
jgi:hypothetical protein